MLRPVIHDVHEQLPDRHPFVDGRDEAVRHGLQPRIDRHPLGLPACAQLVDRRQRLEFRLDSFVGGPRFKKEPPALR